MTRKHFNALAIALAYIRPETQVEGRNYDAGKAEGWGEAVEAVADVCQSQNRQFDRDRFVTACEVWDVAIRDGELKHVS